MSILLHSQKQQDGADPVNCRRQSKQVDAHLRDRIKAVQAHHNQQEDTYDLSRKVLCVCVCASALSRCVNILSVPQGFTWGGTFKRSTSSNMGEDRQPAGSPHCHLSHQPSFDLSFLPQLTVHDGFHMVIITLDFRGKQECVRGVSEAYSTHKSWSPIRGTTWIFFR